MDAYSSIVVKTLAKRLGRSEVAAFRQEMQNVLRLDQPRIVVDFGSVTHLDSAGVEALLHCLSASVRRDGELKLAALSPQAVAILEMTRVGRLFEVFPTVEDAVRSLRCGSQLRCVSSERPRLSGAVEFVSRGAGQAKAGCKSDRGPADLEGRSATGEEPT